MHDETDAEFDELKDRALARLEAGGGDWSRLPEPAARFITVHSARGVRDNGGYRDFFESDWPTGAGPW
ncbi:MAG: hypothetical protein IPM29_19875 [Planctomycetes bacterium]|nr:hypothetical protein [Planctomycetota bacterium]